MSSRITSELRLVPVRSLKLARLARRPALWGAVRRGVLPSLEHARVPFDPQTRTVLDVGASRGQFATLAQTRFPQARIVSFEPLPQARDVLREVTGGGVEIVPAAVGVRPGSAELFVSADDDSSSLLPIGERQQREFPGSAPTGTVTVDVTTLEEHLPEDVPRPLLLKIDVQGNELDVLRGAGTALARVDAVFVECSFVELYEGQPLADEVVVFLHERGFRLLGAYGTTYGASGQALQSDLLFGRAT